jgi:hypothetical protein
MSKSQSNVDSNQKRKKVKRIEGIHVFNQIEILALPSWYFWVVFGVGAPIFTIGLTVFDKSKHNLLKVIGFIVGILAGTSIYVFGSGWQMFKQPTGKYEYTVSIDDTKIHMLEFNEKYEIVNKNGELWIIKDK